MSKTYLGPLLISRSYGGPSSWCCVNHLIDTHVTTVNRFYNTLNYYSSVNPIAYWCCMNYNSIKSENGNLTTIVFPSLLTAKCCISAPCCEHHLPSHVCHPEYKRQGVFFISSKSFQCVLFHLNCFILYYTNCN